MSARGLAIGPLSVRASSRIRSRQVLVRVGPWLALGIFAGGLALRANSVSIKIVAVAGLALVAVWMLASERYERTLAVLIVYLGCLDGYLKLKTGSRVATLGRDVLLYSIVAGALIRFCIRRERVRIPLFTGWVLAFVLLAAVELLNPGTGGLVRGLGAIRPHVEFLPLFFFGYMTMRSRARLRGFLFLLLFAAAVNGVVSLAQFNDSPTQLASWGPGYAADVLGTNGIAARVFATASGVVRIRPFGLGADAGDGGLLATLAVGAALSLLLTEARRVRVAVVLVLAAGAVLAIVTSQTRIAVAGAAVVGVAFVVFSVVRFEGRRLVALLAAVTFGLAIVAVVVTGLQAAGTATSGSFRYSSLTPNRIVATTLAHKGAALAQFPGFAFHYPLGAGMGSVGPAAGFDRGNGNGDALDGETEPDFLVIELGIGGVIIYYGFLFSVLAASVVAIRRIRDSETRVLLAGIAAPVFACIVMGVSGPISSASPTSPYCWFVSGTLAWWIAATRDAGLAAPKRLIAFRRAAAASRPSQSIPSPANE